LNTQKFIDFFKKHSCFFLFFGYVTVYNFAVVNGFSLWSADKISYTYHIVDYSVGFCTKLLPGAIYNFLFDSYSPETVTIFETVVLFIIFALVSFYLSETIRHITDKETKKNIITVFIFFLSGPSTFAVFTRQLGMIDVYWLLISVIFFLFMRNRKLYTFIPMIFAVSVLVHFSCLISYLILFVMIIIYKISQEKEKFSKVILWSVLAVSATVTVCLAVYFNKNETSNLKFTLEEFNRFLDSRYSFDKETYYTYYDYSLYKFYNDKFLDAQLLTQGSCNLPDFVIGFINKVYNQICFVSLCYSQSKDLQNIPLLYALCLPVIVFIYSFLHSHKKSTDSKLKKFAIFIAQVQYPLTSVLGCLFSPDISRWHSHALLIFFSFAIYLMFSERDESAEIINSFFGKIKPMYLFIYYLCYATVYVAPYH